MYTMSDSDVAGQEGRDTVMSSDSASFKEVPVEDQAYAVADHVADSPIALSPGYVTDSDPEDSKDGPVDYPADGGDDDDDDSSDDDEEEKEASK
ncbi:hypothetical protein Tco_1555451 [Tanacetum coccineum]